MSTRPLSGCRLCSEPIATPALPLGALPICNRFARESGAAFRITLDVVACETCQLVQLREVPPPASLTPEVPWIRYREPEGHLDALTAELLSLKPQASTVLGTGPFEAPLLARLEARGLASAALALDGASAPGRHPYLETWQANLNAERLAAEVGRRGTFDIVSCRYIVEHAAEPVQALQALQHLLNPGALLLIEVPDSSKFLAARDYCFLWEEHSCYFVEDTLRRLAEVSGYRVLALLRYPGALEDALAAVLTPADAPPAAAQPLGSSSLFQAYRDNFAPTRTQLRTKLAALAGPDRDRLALFGIGHHAIMFANAFGVADMFALAVDDDADKAGFFPPGFRVPVVGSARLLADERITTCLFAVAPHIEGKVREKLAPLAARGVAFRSIYAALDNAITKDLAP
ncbi:putative S-adenosyl-L-methionine (SAM)-dependent methyltransferase [Bradyrhizobium sp. ORS 285]|uniref:class I SAM-dependent methyltransferase n=1 Tax=Bradyrhizobium sp. ORS 285 TaxID=115808 RepID=UPI0002405B5C|nr:methyltransferase domain-containing protein [Bradyrhizobium sp. ORS 285]CCD83631.1 putative S-adenosyl-L-methionine (SAM)-dependent methyltransferase [Bradyrhizobium sp. ORS 285]SMX57190.1 putative S-adenosyl-L-methionine (SAM)-dependent methyltransferase [Bradyrhizobium sp. ORS 285]